MRGQGARSGRLPGASFGWRRWVCIHGVACTRSRPSSGALAAVPLPLMHTRVGHRIAGL
jgi:hypothetical protein